MRRAISGPEPWSAAEDVTSRNASSRDKGSTSGVKSARIAMMRSDSRAYLSMSTGRKTAAGHSRYARPMGIAEWIPNRRAS